MPPPSARGRRPTILRVRASPRSPAVLRRRNLCGRRRASRRRLPAGGKPAESPSTAPSHNRCPRSSTSSLIAPLPSPRRAQPSRSRTGGPRLRPPRTPRARKSGPRSDLRRARPRHPRRSQPTSGGRPCRPACAPVHSDRRCRMRPGAARAPRARRRRGHGDQLPVQLAMSVIELLSTSQEMRCCRTACSAGLAVNSGARRSAARASSSRPSPRQRSARVA